MRLPLVVLAFFAFFAGALDLPWVHTDDLESFLAPVFAGTLYNDHLGAGPEWDLAVIDIAAAFIGVIVAYMLWRGSEVNKPALEPAFLQRVWYWDDFYDAIIGRPSQRLATFCAWVVDARVIDGAVNGTAHLAKMTGHGGAQAADRLRPQLRAGHRDRPGPHRRLHAVEDVVGMTHSVPFLTLLVLLPAIGAALLGLFGLDRGLDRRVHRELSYTLRADRIPRHPRLRHRRPGRHEGRTTADSSWSRTTSTPAARSGCTGTSASTASPSSWCC